MSDLQVFGTEINAFAAELAALPAKVVSEARGITANHVDIIAAKAKQDALSTWTRYGRGEAGAAGTIRGRMSRNRRAVRGYVLADGQGAFQSEHGTSVHAPQPVLTPAALGQAPAWVSDLSELASDL